MPKNIAESLLGHQAPVTLTLKKALDAQATRQRAHAQNIANAETPGYQRVRVDFEEQLKEALKETGHLARSDPRHLSSSASPDLPQLTPTVVQEERAADGPGMNGVDIDLEMAEMAETQLRYMTALELLKRRYAGIKSAIRGQP